MGIGNPVHLIFLAAIALVVLGPKRLPELARALGQGMREFRESLSEGAASGDGAPAVPVSHQLQPVPAAEPVSHQLQPVPAAEPVSHQTQPAAAAEPVDPAQPVRSGDAPDRRSL